jgi:ketosteroid isomerase-like protein
MRLTNRSVVVLGLIAATTALLPVAAHANAALDSLVASERAFAAMSVAKGMKDAFLTFLAEDAVVFRPTATNGRKVWEERPPSTATLLWEPEFAEVSSAGDLGYTTGPWELHPPADSSGVAAPPERYLYGHFNSVWRRHKGSPWRVVVDIGGSHPKPERGGVGSGQFAAGPELPRRSMKSGRVNLPAMDRALSKSMRSAGAGAAIAAHATADVRLNVDGQFPSLGIEACQARIDSLGGFFEFKPEGSGVASSADLGYTYGLAERYLSAKAAPADTSVYLHVWRQEDGHTWTLALAVINPLAKP